MAFHGFMSSDRVNEICVITCDISSVSPWLRLRWSKTLGTETNVQTNCDDIALQKLPRQSELLRQTRKKKKNKKRNCLILRSATWEFRLVKRVPSMSDAVSCFRQSLSCLSAYTQHVVTPDLLSVCVMMKQTPLVTDVALHSTAQLHGVAPSSTRQQTACRLCGGKLRKVTTASSVSKSKQESSAIAKLTARCALYK